MPLVFDAAHEQGAVERDRAVREPRLVVEEARAHLLDLQRLDVPGRAAQLQPLEARRVGSRGEPERAALEEREASSSELKIEDGGK